MPIAEWPRAPWAWPDPPDARIETGMRRQAQKRLHARGRLIGWKVGGNDLGTRIRWGVRSCVFGYLTDATCRSGDQTWAIGDAKCAAVEAELWFELTRSLDGGESADDVGAAIGAFGLAAELIDARGRFDDVAAVLAGNIFHRAATFAPAAKGVSLADLGGSVLSVERNGHVVWSMPAISFIPDVREAVGFIANGLRLFGRRLEAGQRVMSGVLTPLPVWAQPGDEITVSADRLGAIRLRFTGDAAT